MPEPGKDEDALAHRYIRNAGEPTYDVEERRHIDVPELCDGADIDALFTRFYQTNQWGSGETRSGPGSERARTRQVVRDLNRLIRDFGIRSMLDAPCGDFNWMRDVSLEAVDYLGCDIVEDMIAANSAKYGGWARTFKKLDITVDPMPQVDLILCRDTLVHFSYKRAFATLSNFRASGSKYFLTTTFRETEENVDIGTGWWRPINLQYPPFSFPEPKEVLLDHSDDHYDDKVLALWDLQALRW
ncbi:MAG TPA: class I SAM-dependent methyltransferase [Trebonia sp.]